MFQFKNIAFVFLLIAIAGSVAYLEFIKPKRSAGNNIIATAETKTKEADANTKEIITQKSSQYPKAPEIISPSGFINTPPLKLADLIGKKVIMVDFWTYSCINCQRTTPYLNAWYEKYQDKGLEIIGVHTPEFEFEKKYDNVAGAVKKFGIKYPVVMDNTYATWDNYNNRYWPHKFLIDIDGYVVYDHIGEGGYEETEIKIQELLEEKMARAGTSAKLSGLIKPSDTISVAAASPEIYFGAGRNKFLGNGLPAFTGVQNFKKPSNIEPNTLYLVDRWDITKEFAVNTRPAAKIIFRYTAKGVYMVASGEGKITAEVWRDGKPITADIAGEDVIIEKGRSFVIISEERLYRLVQDSVPGEHIIELHIEEPGLQAYTFTFG